MKILSSVIKSIVDHAHREMPCEACGYLAEKEGVVVCSIEMTNTDRAHDHFAMDPAEQFAAVRQMRNRGLRLAAVYHSHPETPARPSFEDIRLAYDPDISYVIISLAAPEKPVIKSFAIRNGEVSLQDLEIVEQMNNQKKQNTEKYC